jgi:hypothetical protein
MIAGTLQSADVAIDTGALEALRQFGIQQNVIEAQPAVAFPSVPHVIPKRVHRRFRMQRANGVGPALR